MEEVADQIIELSKHPDFWKNAKWVCFTNKYNERFICLQDGFNFTICNLTKGDELAANNTLVEWEKTQPFFKSFMERICLCLNYCRNKTNEELKRS